MALSLRTTPPGPSPARDNLTLAIGKRLTLRGFIAVTTKIWLEEYADSAAGWLADGSLPNETTVVDGIDRAAEGFLGLLAGQNTGKMLVRL